MAEAKKTPGTPNLNIKLAEVAAEVGRVPKRGHNDFHNYDYATESDILETVRQALSSRHVTLQPAILDESYRSVGTKGHVVTQLKMEMQWRDGDSGETLHIPWMGWGVDAADKGGYKAITGAEKYFLLKTFLIPTGDDPETSSADDKAIAETAGPPTRRASSEDVVTVTSVNVTNGSKNGKDWTRFLIHFSDGEKLSTLDERVGNMATQLEGTGEACTYTTEQRGKYTNLKSLSRVDTKPAAKKELDAVADVMEDEPPVPTDDELTLEDVPF